MSAEAIMPVHLQQHTPAPLKAILNAIHNSILWLIPIFTGAGVSASYTHMCTRKQWEHTTDCLLSTPERLATWTLLTFNRIHYGGCAPIQLLLNTKDMDLSFCFHCWLSCAHTAPNPSPCVGLSCHKRPQYSVRALTASPLVSTSAPKVTSSSNITTIAIPSRLKILSLVSVNYIWLILAVPL